MQITFYSFQKRKNSTKLPNDSNVRATYSDALISGECSIHSPILKIARSHYTATMNYAYIPEWNRYYFISDATIQDNYWLVHLNVDVLASFKSTIKGTTAYIERASKNYNDLLEDNAISTLAGISHRSYSSMTLDNWDNEGCFIVRCVGSDNSEFIGGVETYVVTPSGMSTLISYMFDTSNQDIASVITNEAVKAFFNPFQYIIGVMWFPFSADLFDSGEWSSPKLGWWNGTALAGKVTSTSFTVKEATLTSPGTIYPLTDFRAHSERFSRYTMYLPGVGVINVNPDDVNNSPSIKAIIDPITGQITYILTNGQNEKLFTGQIGVNVQVSQIASPLNQVASTVLGIGQNLVSGNIGGAVSTAVSSVSTVAQPTQSINGTQGSMALLVNKNQIRIYVEQYASVSNGAPALVGKPVYKYYVIAGFSEPEDNLYLQCSGVSAAINGLDSEINEINNYMNGGFYFE